jgi:hypothetical protein
MNYTYIPIIKKKLLKVSRFTLGFLKYAVTVGNGSSATLSVQPGLSPSLFLSQNDEYMNPWTTGNFSGISAVWVV